MKILIFLLCSAAITSKSGVFSLGENGDFNDFLNMVNGNISASQSYIIPKDNSALLNVTNTTVNDFGTFDFIIVGAGAAGAVLANRLSEISEWNILLLEAGGQENDFTKILGLSAFTYFSDMSWGYNTTSQTHGLKGFKNQQAFLPQGKVIGGGTTINAGVYARGHPEDYDRWVDVYGNKGWSYDEVLPYFKKSEKAVFQPKEAAYHGLDGYFTVDHTSDTPELENPIINGFKELGLDLVDYHGKVQNGISQTQNALKGNERVSTGRAFLENFKNRTNLIISDRSFVTEILINANCAEGVKFIKNGRVYQAKRRKEVILSAGAINSAQLLMLSGVGPKKHLNKLGIPVKTDAPVGENLNDHVTFLGFFFRTNRTFFSQNFTEQLRLYTENKRPLTSGFGNEMIGFTNFGQGPEKRAEIEFIFAEPVLNGQQVQTFFGLTDEYRDAFKTNLSDLWVVLVLMHPESRGNVTLLSKYIKDKPLINPSYLSVEKDVDTIYKGIQFLEQLGETNGLKSIGAEVLALDYPDCTQLEKKSENWWKCAIRHLSTTLYHPVATTIMGSNHKTSVVSTNLTVHGIKGLRVIDGGVLPETNSGHVMAPIIMVGEKGADIIKEAYGKL